MHRKLVLEDDTTNGLHLLATQLTKKKGARVVLLVNQFEEMFTLTTDEAERRQFFNLLVTAVTKPHGPLFVLLTLRADFYGRPMHYSDLYRLIDAHHISVLPLALQQHLAKHSFLSGTVEGCQEHLLRHSKADVSRSTTVVSLYD